MILVSFFNFVNQLLNGQIQFKIRILYIDDQQQQSALILKDMGTYIMNSMGGAGILVLLLGNSFILRGVIEVLQQQSYLRFINVIFPLNLFIYFESSNLISSKSTLFTITVQPLLDFSHFNSFSSKIMEMPFIESYEKLKFYQVNADILNNIQTQIFLSLLMIFSYISCVLMIQLFTNMDHNHFIQFGLNIGNFIVKIQRNCLKIKKQFEKEGLKEFLITNSWDLLFMSFLQIHSQSINAKIGYFLNKMFLYVSYLKLFLIGCRNARTIISFILAYLIIYICVIIMSSYFLRENKATSFSKYWIKKFELFLISKKLLFIGILVLFQRSQQIQSILQINYNSQRYQRLCVPFIQFILYQLNQNQKSLNLLIYLLWRLTFLFFVQQLLCIGMKWKIISIIIIKSFQAGFTLLCYYQAFVIIHNLITSILAVLEKLKKVLVKKLQQFQNNEHLEKDPYPLQNVMQFKI